MARKISIALLLAILAATILQLQTTFAATYTVGDSTGWLRPTNNNIDLYDNWADNKNFLVVFTFSTGQHDVAEVSEATYESCIGTNPISLVRNVRARITLNRTGDHFICTIAGHCAAGQKLTIDVLNGTNTTASSPNTLTSGPSPNSPTSGPSQNSPTGVSTTPSSAPSFAAPPSLLSSSPFSLFSCLLIMLIL